MRTGASNPVEEITNLTSTVCTLAYQQHNLIFGLYILHRMYAIVCSSESMAADMFVIGKYRLGLEYQNGFEP